MTLWPTARVEAGGGFGVIEIDGYGTCVPIGRGGVGAVYRSTRLSTGADVAIKVLHQVSDESAAWRRTRRELAAMVALAGHAHVIGVLEVHDLPDGPALVMEYAPGGSVGDLMAQRSAPLAVGEAAFIGEHASKALIAAHARGIVHRDVKPHNLLIDGFGQVKLCDFGIASLARSDEFRLHTHSVSLRYASPEDLEGDDTVGPKTDIYSLGATLLHMVHGAPPSWRDRVASWEPPPAAPGSDMAAIDSVIVECLQVDPNDRPAASEVFDLLEHLPWSGFDRRRAIAGAVPTPAPPTAFAAADPRERSVSSEFSRTGARAGVAVVEEIDGPNEPTIARPTAMNTAALASAVSQSPAPAQRWQRWLPIAAPAVVLIGIGVLFVWQRLSHDPPANAPAAQSVEVVERPTDLVELTLLAWPTGAVGECLVQPTSGDSLESVECSAAHDLQRAAVGHLVPLDVAADDGALTASVNERCADAWDVLVQQRGLVFPANVIGRLQLSNVRPSANAAAEGAAGYQCFIGVPGERLVGSALGFTTDS
ncbi:MAG TPA: serine/threonine-protein kinase [Ilumatobacter sp.]|nr:serine/threonine-protein kinase [Ilumatobacter sp.]